MLSYCVCSLGLRLNRHCLNRGEKYWRWDKYESGLVRYCYTFAEKLDNKSLVRDTAKVQAQLTPDQA